MHQSRNISTIPEKSTPKKKSSFVNRKTQKRTGYILERIGGASVYEENRLREQEQLLYLAHAIAHVLPQETLFTGKLSSIEQDMYA